MSSPPPQGSGLKRTRAEDDTRTGPTARKKSRPSDVDTDSLPDVSAARVHDSSSPSSPDKTDKGKQRMIDERPVVDTNATLVAELETELSCGCCAGIVYRPVIIQPCQHFFCGSCLTQWIKNSNSNTCPECRQVSTVAVLSRTIQSIVDLFIRHRPDLQRSENERRQADEIWAPVPELKIPQPRPPNPDILLPQSRAHDPSSDNLARPCPHCLPNNQFGWRCPRPIADAESNPTDAWNLDNGPPPGHGFCGACSELHALSSPGSSTCSLCHTSFCGLSIPHLCVASSVRSSRLPPSASTLTGLLEGHSEGVWEAFDFNEVEIEVLLDWLREGRRGGIRTVYQEMIDHVRLSPEGFKPMIDTGLFVTDQATTNPLPDSELRHPDGHPIPPLVAGLMASRSDRLVGQGQTSTSSSVSQAPRALDSAIPAPPGAADAASNSVAMTVNDLRQLFMPNIYGIVDEEPLPPPTFVLPPISSTNFASVFSGAAGASSSTSYPMHPFGVGVRTLGTDNMIFDGASQSALYDHRAPSDDAVLPAAATAAPPPPAPPSSEQQPNVSRICRDCAFEIFLHELYPWWERERRSLILAKRRRREMANDLGGSEATTSSSSPQQARDYIVFEDDEGESDDDGASGHAHEEHEEAMDALAGGRPMPSIPAWVETRLDCPEGRHCSRQREMAHAKEFNHIIGPADQPPVYQGPPSTPTTKQSSESLPCGSPSPQSTSTVFEPPAADNGSIRAVVSEDAERAEQMEVDAAVTTTLAPPEVVMGEGGAPLPRPAHEISGKQGLSGDAVVAVVGVEEGSPSGIAAPSSFEATH